MNRQIAANLFVLFTLGLVIAFELPKAQRLLNLNLTYTIATPARTIVSASPRLWLLIHWIVSIIHLFDTSSRYLQFSYLDYETSWTLHRIFLWLILVNCPHAVTASFWLAILLNSVSILCLDELYKQDHMLGYISVVSVPLWLQFGKFVIDCVVMSLSA